MGKEAKVKGKVGGGRGQEGGGRVQEGGRQERLPLRRQHWAGEKAKDLLCEHLGCEFSSLGQGKVISPGILPQPW